MEKMTEVKKPKETLTEEAEKRKGESVRAVARLQLGTGVFDHGEKEVFRPNADMKQTRVVPEPELGKQAP
ncbi:hypothetical protein GBF38_010334 [Nibea albiflora]|uniref:Uncharacterized protein n=1 Tax=Nibea albiflora TaxID=240163 RepID=A0ACB7F2J0_NIBAL|nr:hypothetical protein GBF38_010334 [Nibea albiflora]